MYVLWVWASAVRGTGSVRGPADARPGSPKHTIDTSAMTIVPRVRDTGKGVSCEAAGRSMGTLVSLPWRVRDTRDRTHEEPCDEPEAIRRIREASSSGSSAVLSTERCAIGGKQDTGVPGLTRAAGACTDGCELRGRYALPISPLAERTIAALSAGAASQVNAHHASPHRNRPVRLPMARYCGFPSTARPRL